jgi:hypothetical protein
MFGRGDRLYPGKSHTDPILEDPAAGPALYCNAQQLLLTSRCFVSIPLLLKRCHTMEWTRDTRQVSEKIVRRQTYPALRPLPSAPAPATTLAALCSSMGIRSPRPVVDPLTNGLCTADAKRCTASAGVDPLMTDLLAILKASDRGSARHTPALLPALMPAPLLRLARWLNPF